MVKIYYKHGSHYSETTKRIQDWLKAHDVSAELSYMEDITREDILMMLKNTENGFQDLFTFRATGNAKKFEELQEMSTEEAIRYLVEHPQYLRNALIFDEKHLQLGWHKDDIRQFVSRERRQLALSNYGVVSGSSRGLRWA